MNHATKFLILSILMLGSTKAFAQFDRSEVEVGNSPYLLAKADLDNDGDLDLAVTNTSDSSVSVLLNDGSGAFSEAYTPGVDNPPYGIAAADLDADGDIDLAVATTADDDSGNVRIIQNTLIENGSPGFSTFGTPFPVGDGPRFITAADFDGDSAPDLAVTELFVPSGEDNVTVLANDGSTPGSYSFSEAARLNAGVGAAGIVSGSFDGDGDPDLAVTNLTSDDISFFRNESTVSNILFVEDTTVAAGNGPAGLEAADLEGDGDLDLVAANYNSSDVTVLENDGQFSFTNSSTPGVSTCPIDVTTADLDGDGDLDIIASENSDEDCSSSHDGSSVYFLENDGELQFAPFPVSSQSVGTGPYGIVAGDLDGNTAAGPDLAVAGYGSSDPGTVTILLRTGTPLPVELASFEATADGSDVLLSWRTVSETSNDGFEVQRKVDGAFEPIAYEKGAGTTTEPQSYHHRVRDLTPGTHAFRLKQVDADGTAAYSETVEMKVGVDGRFHLGAAHPNPFQTETRFDLTVDQRQSVRVEIFDLMGRRVALLHDGPLLADEPKTFQLESASLANGTYLIRVSGQTFSDSRQVTVLR